MAEGKRVVRQYPVEFTPATQGLRSFPPGTGIDAVELVGYPVELVYVSPHVVNERWHH